MNNEELIDKSVYCPLIIAAARGEPHTKRIGMPIGNVEKNSYEVLRFCFVSGT